MYNFSSRRKNLLIPLNGRGKKHKKYFHHNFQWVEKYDSAAKWLNLFLSKETKVKIEEN